MQYIEDGNIIKTQTPLDFKAILTCGQTFRFKERDGGYEVCSGEYKCFARGNEIVSSNPSFFVSFFDLDTDYDEYMGRLNKFDELKEYLKIGKGIRILRQDLYEMIISFIISQNNNIPRIQGIIERLCDYYGEDKGDHKAFPTPERLARVSKEEFKMLGAGYRDDYLCKTAGILYESDFLERVTRASSEDAHKMLLTLPGVGPKVADCILLFGLRRFDSFPVDTWIMKKCGTQELDTPQKVRLYYMGRYGSLAGLAQQYIFYGAREEK